jgi:hypothetical protein
MCIVLFSKTLTKIILIKEILEISVTLTLLEESDKKVAVK